MFRLHGLRDAHNSLRALVLKTSGDAVAVPAFDDQDGYGCVCGLGVCNALCESLLSLTLTDSCEDVARSGTGGGGVSSSAGASVTRKTSRKRPAPPVSSPRGGGNGDGGGVTKKPRQSARSASAKKQQQQQKPSGPPDKPELYNAGAAVVVAPGNSATIRAKHAEQAESVSAAVRAVVASDAGASAWKLPRKKKTTAPATAPAAVPAAASATVVASSPTAASCYATSSGSNSPSSADVAAAAAAVASETANAVAAATTSIATHPRPADQPTVSADVGVGRFGGTGDLSDGAGGMWPARTWQDARGGGGGITGINVSSSEGFPVSSAGMINKNNGDRSHAPGQGHQQDSFLPPLSGSLLRPQSGGTVTGYNSGGGGGGDRNNSVFMSSSSHYTPSVPISTAMRHDSRDTFNVPFSVPGTENHNQSQQQQQQQQRRVEVAALGNNEFEAAGGGGGGGGGGSGGTGLSPSHRSSVAWWRTDTFPPSSSAAASAVTSSSSGAGGVLPAVTVTSGAWPMQESATSVAATSGAAQTMSWAESNSSTRNGVPAWFGGGNGAGPITLPPPDRNSGSNRDWAGGAGGGRHHTTPSSFAAGPAVAHRWQQGPAVGESGPVAGPGPLGGAGFAAKLLGPTHTHSRGGPGFRSGGGQYVVDAGTHAGRRQQGRSGNEFDFVYELGMLLDEDEFPGVSQQQVGR